MAGGFAPVLIPGVAIGKTPPTVGGFGLEIIPGQTVGAPGHALGGFGLCLIPGLCFGAMQTVPVPTPPAPSGGGGGGGGAGRTRRVLERRVKRQRELAMLLAMDDELFLVASLEDD